MMKNYDGSVKVNNNLNWSFIPDLSFRILIIVGWELGKTNMLLTLT